MSVVRWQVVYFVDERGKSPVEEWAISLTVKERATFVKKVEMLKVFGTTLKEPHAKHVSGKLWELRYTHNKRAFRVFYFNPIRNEIVLLHAIVKTTNKLPRHAVEIALKRLDDYLRR
ncbi:MAG: type II toxin-antitoxin system RelE/ParE family toxin [Chloroflexota bacterium]